MPPIVEARFLGPYSWHRGGSVPCVFGAPNAAAAGLYLWTVAQGDAELVYYVGQTGRSFEHRLFEHLKEHLGGAYHVYDPSAFLGGKKLPLWAGVYGRKRDEAAAALLSTFESLVPAILDLARGYRFFLAPLRADRRVRERAEAAIAAILYSSARGFQDSGVRYRPRRPSEDPLQLRILSERPLLDLPLDIAI